jgi:hypothetical protein
MQQEERMNRSGITAAAALVAIAVLGSSALALPRPASGANCNSNWVNNSGAMQCFTTGEEESNAGAAHPHYVACLAGQIYCCKDDDRGQNCEAVMSVHPVTSNDWMKAVLAAHRAQAARMSRIPTGSGRTKPPTRAQ